MNPLLLVLAAAVSAPPAPGAGPGAAPGVTTPAGAAPAGAAPAGVTAPAGAAPAGAAPAGVTAPAAMTTAPKIGPLPPLRPARPATFTLGNGLRVVAIRRPAVPLVALRLVAPAGADRDPTDRAGLAAATADMLDEGAGDRGALEIARDLERLGATLSTYAGRDAATVGLQVPAAGLTPALAIAADVVRRPRFSDEDWRRVQGDRLTALAQRRDQPEQVAAVVADRALFGEVHPYGRPVSGWTSTIGAFTAGDLRRFHEAHWRPGGATLVVAGDFDPKRLRAQVEAAFGSWAPAAAGGAAARGAAGKGPAPEEAGGPAGAGTASPSPRRPPRFVLVDRPDAPQTVLRVVGPGAARSDAARPGLSLLTTILGGSFTSRLNANLREKHGYTYGAGARIDFLRRPGAFVVASSVFAKVTDAALRELLAEIGGLRSGPVTAEELRKARALLQQQIAENLATTEGTVGLYADLAAYDRPADDPARFVAALGRADAAALRLLAARAIDEGALTIVAVGDRKTVEPALRALGLPAPEIRDADGAVVK